ncbi:DUF3891 family protein [Fontivita pretiosa]|uniref:DUF3891 family protein n=1 Tax=Fontivita pretiosa TaxID=2989684 RepID=UPI003D17CF08
MIRRQVGNEYWLITQDDHARLAGELARHLGNDRFSPPSSQSAILGIAMHDSGWPLHDQAPSLNARGQPLDVFESPRELALKVWEESARRAAAQDDYAGLLVSLHSLALSIFAASHPSASGPSSRWNLSDPRARFEINRFQHNMIELQESLRKRLGMRTDRPLTNGLADPSTTDPKEQRLTFDFRLLQAMDTISLGVCCTTPPFSQVQQMLPRPGATTPVTLQLRRADDVLAVDPWPFSGDEIRVRVPIRRLRAQRWDDESSFRRAYAAAPVEYFSSLIRRG